jgi:peptide/nickel transport system permease protein
LIRVLRGCPAGWLAYPPAIILIATVVAFNMIGYTIRGCLDVRLQRP